MFTYYIAGGTSFRRANGHQTRGLSLITSNTRAPRRRRVADPSRPSHNYCISSPLLPYAAVLLLALACCQPHAEVRFRECACFGTSCFHALACIRWLRSVTYGPFNPVRPEEVTMTIVSMLCGACFYASVIGTAANSEHRLLGVAFAVILP